MINDVFVVDAGAHSYNLGEDNYAVGRYSQAVAPGSEIDQSEDLRVRYRLIREFSEQLHETLEPDDCVVQTMPEASPVKWHLAHTSWFLETFVLKEALPNHNPI